MKAELETVDIKSETHSSPRYFWHWAIISVAITTFTLLTTTIYMGLATLAYGLMVGGLLFKREKALHVGLMNTAIGIDVALVLLLEFQREAIGTALAMTLTTVQQLHILFSSIALSLYFPILFMGWRLYKNTNRFAVTRKWHLRTGILAFIFRSIGFLLMYSMISHVMN